MLGLSRTALVGGAGTTTVSLLWHRCLSIREYFEDDCSRYVNETEVEEM